MNGSPGGPLTDDKDHERGRVENHSRRAHPMFGGDPIRANRTWIKGIGAISRSPEDE